MIYAIESFTRRLKGERIKKGLSQRAFAQSIGIPQSRLSKIENAAVDLQLSNFLEIARSLDLEVMLIQRKSVPVLNHLIRQSESGAGSTEMKPMYSLDDEGDEDDNV